MFKLNADGSYHLHFLLLPGYSMASLQAAIDPLRKLNLILDSELFKWKMLALDEQPALASNGLALACLNYRSAAPENLLICASQQAWLTTSWEIQSWLQRCYRQGSTLCAIGGGAQLLAEAGLLTEGPVSVQGAIALELKKRFHALQLSQQPFTLHSSAPLHSCAGGFAATGMMLHIIAEYTAEETAQLVAQSLLLPGEHAEIRSPDLRLRKAQQLMQTHLATPLSSRQLAQQLNISARQLERLFQQNLQQTPGRYYLKTRLNRARYLLRYSNISLLQIAYHCGFKSQANFSRNYSLHLGIGPKRERSSWLTRNAS